MNYTSQEDHAAYVKTQLINDEEDKDWAVVIASDMMLMLDFDTPEIPQTFITQLEIMEQAFRTTVTYTVTPSRSGNKHVIVHLPVPMSLFERIAWQAVLGSDPKREALHLLAVAKDEKNPVVLVMPRVKNLLADGDRDKQALLTEEAECQLPIGADDICGLPEDSPIHTTSPQQHNFVHLTGAPSETPETE